MCHQTTLPAQSPHFCPSQNGSCEQSIYFKLPGTRGAVFEHPTTPRIHPRTARGISVLCFLTLPSHTVHQGCLVCRRGGWEGWGVIRSFCAELEHCSILGCRRSEPRMLHWQSWETIWSLRARSILSSRLVTLPRVRLVILKGGRLTGWEKRALFVPLTGHTSSSSVYPRSSWSNAATSRSIKRHSVRVVDGALSRPAGGTSPLRVLHVLYVPTNTQ